MISQLHQDHHISCVHCICMQLGFYHGVTWYNLEDSDLECYSHVKGKGWIVTVSLRRRALHNLWRRWQAA